MSEEKEFADKLSEQFQKEQQEVQTLTININSAEEELQRAKSEKDQRIGRLTLLQEQIRDFSGETPPEIQEEAPEEEPKPKRGTAKK